MKVPSFTDLLGPLPGIIAGLKSYRLFKAIDSPNNAKALKFLKKKRNIFNLKQANTGLNPLHLVTMKNDTQLIEAITVRQDCKAHINDQDNDQQWAAIHFAAQNGNSEALTYFLKLGANISIKNKEGSGPIHIAAGHNHKDFIQKLIERSVHIDERDAKMRTALHYSAVQNFADLAEWLVSKGASTSVVDSVGMTPIYVAVHAGSFNVTEFLHNYKDGYTKIPGSKCKLIHLACRHQDTKILEFLHANGHDLWDFDNEVDRESVYHYAALDGAVNCIDYLVSKNIAIDRQDSRGLTPLHIAVGVKNLAVIKKLCEAGAKLDIPNIEGLSPFDMAESVRDHATLTLLRRFKR
ncbi:unnamed protein product [Blepharisma stoltei]|uniref:Uncharacterized protein n=1 Tax=Blepharisma stoltei TaxID=1481888 RepID=A0AAU9I6A3_9CILI|nr:unnamed protein product [Blepharisma stoltei]